MKLFDFLQQTKQADQKNIITALAHFRNIAYPTLRLQKDIFLSQTEVEYLQDISARLQKKEPLTKILGCNEFYGFNFLVTKDVLDPRQDSETLIDTVCSDYTDQNAKLSLLDLGTGSGCLIITLLLLYPHATAVALDISKKALDIAKKNAQIHNVENRSTFCHSSWFEALESSKKTMTFDCIITNPPYIQSTYPLDDAVKNYDPHEALYAGQDGLDDYKKIIPFAGRYLKKNGRFYCEIGFDQKSPLQNLIHEQSNLKFIRCIKDYSDNDRVIVAKKV